MKAHKHKTRSQPVFINPKKGWVATCEICLRQFSAPTREKLKDKIQFGVSTLNED